MSKRKHEFKSNRRELQRGPMKNLIRIGVLACLPILLGASLAYSAQCAAITKKGAQCKRQAPAGEMYCWQHAGKASIVTIDKKPVGSMSGEKSPSAVKVSKTKDARCQAITKKGAQCKRQSEPGTMFCWQHKSKSSEKAESRKMGADSVKTKGSELNISESISAQCQAITKKGAQCKRKAKSGSRYCWQHGG